VPEQVSINAYCVRAAAQSAVSVLQLNQLQSTPTACVQQLNHLYACCNSINYKSLLPKLANDGALGSGTGGVLTGTTWFWMGDGGFGTVVDGNEIGAGGNARAGAVPAFSFS